MSEIKEKLNQDIKEAMKARDQEKLLILRGLMAAIKQVEIDTRKDLDEPTLLGILQKEVKKRKDALKFAADAGRAELVAQNEQEIAIINSYLGEQIDEAALKSIIMELVSSGSNSIGAIMGELNSAYRGKFEGAAASRIAKELLQTGK